MSEIKEATVEEKLHVSFDALEAAASRLAEDRERINKALETIGSVQFDPPVSYLKRRSAAARARRAAEELERERLFLLECAKRFRGAQTRAVVRGGKL